MSAFLILPTLPPPTSNSEVSSFPRLIQVETDEARICRWWPVQGEMMSLNLRYVGFEATRHSQVPECNGRLESRLRAGLQVS